MKMINFIVPIFALTSIVSIANISTSCSTSKWANTVYCQLGDSITWNDGHTDHQTHETLRGFKAHMKDMGFKQIDNLAYSAACIAETNPETVWYDLPLVVDSLDFKNYGLVTIAAGTNDFNANSTPIGEFKESDFDKTTYKGAYQYIIKKIKKDNPDVKIAIFTPLMRKTYATPNRLGLVLKDYVDATIEIAQHYKIPCLDLFSQSGLTIDNLEENTYDGLHLNNKGYDLVSPKMIDFLNSI